MMRYLGESRNVTQYFKRENVKTWCNSTLITKRNMDEAALPWGPSIHVIIIGSHCTPCPSPRLPKGGPGASVLGQGDQGQGLPPLTISWTARVREVVSGAQTTLLVLTRGYKRGCCTSKELKDGLFDWGLPSTRVRSCLTPGSTDSSSANAHDAS